MIPKRPNCRAQLRELRHKDGNDPTALQPRGTSGRADCGAYSPSSLFRLAIASSRALSRSFVSSLMYACITCRDTPRMLAISVMGRSGYLIYIRSACFRVGPGSCHFSPCFCASALLRFVDCFGKIPPSRATRRGVIAMANWGERHTCAEHSHAARVVCLTFFSVRITDRRAGPQLPVSVSADSSLRSGRGRMRDLLVH